MPPPEVGANEGSHSHREHKSIRQHTPAILLCRGMLILFAETPPVIWKQNHSTSFEKLKDILRRSMLLCIRRALLGVFKNFEKVSHDPRYVVFKNHNAARFGVQDLVGVSISYRELDTAIS